MKKLVVLLFILGITSQLFSQNNINQVVGKWKYSVDTGSEYLTGEINFTKEADKLSGKAVSAEGTTIPFSKVELKEDNLLYIEIQTDSDVLKVNLKLNNESFSGTVSTYQGEAPITGKKITEP